MKQTLQIRRTEIKDKEILVRFITRKKKKVGEGVVTTMVEAFLSMTDFARALTMGEEAPCTITEKPAETLKPKEVEPVAKKKKKGKKK